MLRQSVVRAAGRRVLLLVLAAWPVGGSSVRRADALPRLSDVSAELLPLAERDVPPQINGGAAIGDCDGDGWPDIYFPAYAEHILLRNAEGQGFVDATERSGLPEATYSLFFAGRGAAWGDVDNDGDLDLFVTGYAAARHFLFINDGQCRFTEEAVQRGVAVETLALGRSASFGDFDRDGYLDLFVTEMQSDVVNPGVPRPVSHLFHNRGAVAPGYFEDVTERAGVALDDVPGSQPGTFPFTPRFVDFDRDGWPDLAIASDFFESRLFWNLGDGTFLDGTASAGVSTVEYGMGAVTADFDGDGELDWFVTSIYLPGHVKGTGNRLYRYAGQRQFVDVTDLAGVRDGGWGWGAEALDFDNDGDVDLAMTNGTLAGDADQYAELEFGPVDLSRFVQDPARFWVNEGQGVFLDRAAEVGFRDLGVGNALLAFDFDRDGDLDLLLVHDHSQPPVLYRNDGGNEQNWVVLSLRGRHSNRFGIGARVTLSARGIEQVREASASSTLYGQNGDGMVHFGLANAETIDWVRIDWPSGIRQTVRSLAANRYITVFEPESCAGLAETDCVWVPVGTSTPLPTISPSPTPTPPSPTSTLTPTLTPTLTMMPTPTATLTSPPNSPCAGDCNGDRIVTVDEIVLLVRAVLFEVFPESCTSADVNSDRTITVEEVVGAVVRALTGCAENGARARPDAGQASSGGAGS